MPAPQDLAQRFATFFQAFWLAPVTTQTERLMTFRGEAEGFSAVIRKCSDGRPLTKFRSNLVGGVIEIDMRQWLNNGQKVVLDLFGNQSDADAYFSQSANGWTGLEMETINNPVLLNMIPDVSFAPQNLIRAARHQCDPRDPESVALMNAELLVNYRRFSTFDGRVLPDVTRPGLRGTLIAAPGNPPEWIPPD